ncbi:hypothetical protein D5125_13705 [Magnetovirga frankeli]|uniref:radical SAM/SPASM domain-containing protein n=1 Tax=Magnetovirga frankeli TaxID=947516 RepID=UPI0012936EDB|nr:hypothetical protein D5125_13705 [gamma proteobacterium SS-5]
MISATNNLRLLWAKRRLRSYLDTHVLSLNEEHWSVLRRLAQGKQRIRSALPLDFPLDELVAARLLRVYTEELNQSASNGSVATLQFVEAVNIELTYSCVLDCAHCLQSDLRHAGNHQWIDPSAVEHCLVDARNLGLVETGVNLTGGEVIQPGSNLLEILNITATMGLPVRLNTSAWWGAAERVRLGDHRFSPGDLLDYLIERGMKLIALSVDGRYRQYPSLWSALVKVLSLCDQRKLATELLFTGVSGPDIRSTLALLRHQTGSPLGSVIPGGSDVVDIEDSRNISVSPPRVSGDLSQTDCALKRFYRPRYLHIAPDGGVRTCMFASGAGWLGNIHEQSLWDIAKGFPQHRLPRAFATLEVTGDEPKSASRPSHPCAQAISLANKILERGSGPKGQKIVGSPPHKVEHLGGNPPRFSTDVVGVLHHGCF